MKSFRSGRFAAAAIFAATVFGAAPAPHYHRPGSHPRRPPPATAPPQCDAARHRRG